MCVKHVHPRDMKKIINLVETCGIQILVNDISPSTNYTLNYILHILDLDGVTPHFFIGNKIMVEVYYNFRRV